MHTSLHNCSVATLAKLVSAIKASITGQHTDGHVEKSARSYNAKESIDVGKNVEEDFALRGWGRLEAEWVIMQQYSGVKTNVIHTVGWRPMQYSGGGHRRYVWTPDVRECVYTANGLRDLPYPLGGSMDG